MGTIENSELMGLLSAVENRAVDCRVILQGIPGRLQIPPRWEVRRVLKGEHLFYFPVEGAFEAAKVGPVSAGDLLWYPPGAPVHVWLPPGGQVVLYRFRLWSGPARPFARVCPEFFPQAHVCRPWVERLVEEDPPRLYSPQRVRGLLLGLCTELLRLRGDSAAYPASAGGLSPAQKNRVEELLHERTLSLRLGRTTWPDPSELARVARLSPDYFTRVFRQTYGMAPRRWLVEQRVRRAALRLVESTLSVSEVAAEFGYDTVFLFSRQFRDVLGESPTDYRRRAVA